MTRPHLKFSLSFDMAENKSFCKWVMAFKINSWNSHKVFSNNDFFVLFYKKDNLPILVKDIVHDHSQVLKENKYW